MILEDKLVWQRYFKLIMIILVSIAGVLSCALLQNLDQFKWMALLFCGLLVSILVALSIERERMRKGYLHEKANNYTRIAIYYTICNLAVLLLLFLPSYLRPVFLLSALMTLVSNPVTGLVSGIYFSLLLSLSGGGGAYLLACYLLLSVCGCIIINFLGKKENLLWSCLFTGMYACCTVMIFSYLERFVFNLKLLMTGVVHGMAGALFFFILYYFFYPQIEHKKEAMLHKIIQEDFPLVQAMQSFSKHAYGHARRVSRMAAEGARLIGADPYIAAAGGFYYRLGCLEGEPYVENGVAVAKANKFPIEIIEILSEYNGEQRLPTTIESALIHIIDNIVTKFELIDKTTLASTWNQDMVVYQTLNEKSAKGMYDKAGLSMNMFMKLREYLIKEAGQL